MFVVGSDDVADRLPYVTGGPVHVDLHGADHRDHGHALLEADLLARQVDVARIRIVASALLAGVHIDDGYRDTAAWVRGVLDVSKSTAFQWVRRGRLAVSFPVYAEALEEGRLHLDHYDEIARAHANPRVRSQLGDFLDEFVRGAARLQFPDFARLVDVWIQLADSDGPVPLESNPDRSFAVRIRRDGSCKLTGHFGPESAAVIMELLAPFLDRETEIDRERAEADGTPGEYARSASERRADAFMALITQAVATPPGAPARPLTTIVTDLDTAQRALTGVDPMDPASIAHRMCRTADGQSVSLDALASALVQGDVQVLILDALRRPFALGKPGSLFSPRAREAIRALSPECVVPGCGVVSRHLQADHVVPRSQGGATDMANAAGVCGFHNRWRHNHGYHLYRDPDGVWHLLRPDGTPVRPPSPGHPHPQADDTAA